MTLDYAQHYAKFHTDDPRHRNGLSLLHRRLLGPHLPVERDAPILDVGCGRGYALQDMRALGYTRTSGIDLDTGQVAFARGLGLDAVQVGSTEEFLADKISTYAVIVLMDVLEHVPRENQQHFLQAIARSLRPGGRLICTVPNAGSSIEGFWLHNDYTHQSSFTADSLTFLLEQSGFGGARCSAVEFFPRPRFLFWLPIPRTLAWLLRSWFRFRRRLEYIVELGWARGRAVILSPNLLAVADKAG
jgi:SAM-dependent methyltransferase